jgi:putative transposase
MTFPEELYWENIPDHMFTAFESRCALVELLLDDEVPRSEKRREKEEYMRTWKVGDRTIRRYCHVYRKKGPGALLFYTKREKAKRIDDPALAAKITELIQERPDRSVPKLRRLLSQNPDYCTKVAAVSDRTIYRFLDEHGMGRAHRRRMSEQPSRMAFHQFEASCSLALVQGDARDGIWLPGEGNKPYKTYLFLWIDDYSRKILFGKYYTSEKLYCLQDAFKHMVLRYGIPDKMYLDNGSVYISKHFAFILHQLRIRKIHHKPYQAWCKGKVEAANRIILQDFQKEAAIAGFKTLDELNTAFWAWSELSYNKRINSTTGQTPDDRFLAGLREDQQRVVDLAWFQSLFFFRENRKISKYGKIKLHGNQYPVTKLPYNTVVQVRFDPCDLREVYIFDHNEAYVETTTPVKQVTIDVPNISGEQHKSPRTVSLESRNYFTKLREAYLAKHKDESAVDFTAFYAKEEKHDA